jgi:hypothetical protein
MPHAYSIAPKLRLVYCRVWGRITLIDVLAAHRTLLRDPKFDGTFTIVHEFMDADLTNLSAEVIQDLATTNNFAPSAPRAFVATEPDHIAAARMFQIHRRLSGSASEVMVCRSLEEALQWVGAPDFIPSTLTLVV